MPASVSGEAQMAFREGIATPVCVTLSWVSLQGPGPMGVCTLGTSQSAWHPTGTQCALAVRNMQVT